MILLEPQLAKSDFLQIFNQRQVFLLLGAAITTIGVLAACQFS
jgi:hypothetical protein